MSGLKYPLEVANGGLVLADGHVTRVRGAIMSGVLTEVEERVLRPEYGRDVVEFVSVNNLVNLLASIRYTVQQALEGYPDTTFEVLGNIAEDGLVALEITFQCLDHPDTENIELFI